jgi:DNA polymerase I
MVDRILVDATNFTEVISLSDKFDIAAIDTETNGLDSFNGNRIIGISLYFPIIETSYYISVRHPGDNNVPEWWYKQLIEALPGMAKVWVLFNSKFDMHMLYADGMRDFEKIEDVMIAAQLLNENEWLSNNYSKKGAFKLKRLAKKYLGDWAVEGEGELEKQAKAMGFNAKTEMWKLPAEAVSLYAMMDTEITWYLRQFYMPKLEEWKQVELYERRNLFVLKALLRMERNGMQLNADTIRKHQADLEPKMFAIQQDFNVYLEKRGIRLEGKKGAVDWVNLNSPQQMKAFFKLRGHNIDTTNAAQLAIMSESGDEWATKLLTYRSLSKADSTYYTPYLEAIDTEGLVHTNLNAIGTDSGRLSSDNPNLQQIPRKSKKYIVKEVFEPRPGYALVSCDYKQAELRIGTYFAGEETMRKMFNSGVDMHRWTANQMGITRQIAKNANFGLIFGMGAERAIAYIGVKSLEESKEVVKNWRALYPAFMKALYRWQEMANTGRNKDETRGGNFKFIRLFNGRIRHYHELLKHGYDYTRDAWNFQVQGTNAAILEESMLRVVLALPDNDIFKPVLTIHDSFMFEVKIGHEDEVIPLVKSILIDWPELNPKFDADVEFTLTNWLEMRAYKPKLIERYIRRFSK